MQVRIPGLLRSYTHGAETVGVEARSAAPTLAEALADLDARFPGFRFRIIDEQGAIRPHIKVFVNRVQAPSLDRALEPADEVLVVAALSGG